jgi:hypothetical protein
MCAILLQERRLVYDETSQDQDRKHNPARTSVPTYRYFDLPGVIMEGDLGNAKSSGRKGTACPQTGIPTELFTSESTWQERSPLELTPRASSIS